MNAVDLVQLKLFLAALEQAAVSEKDPRIDALIRDTLAREPDAAYLLVQRVMQLESALCGAQATGPVPHPKAASVSARPAALPASRGDDPWWRRPVPALATAAFLFRSTEFLLGERTLHAISRGAR